MEKVIEITHRAVADYGFRLAVLYGSEDIARRWELSEEEKTLLEGTSLPLLAALPNPVEPEDVAAEQERLTGLIHASAVLRAMNQSQFGQSETPLGTQHHPHPNLPP